MLESNHVGEVKIETYLIESFGGLGCDVGWENGGIWIGGGEREWAIDHLIGGEETAQWPKGRHKGYSNSLAINGGGGREKR